MPTRFELVIRVLQTHALPLGYGTIYYVIIKKRFLEETVCSFNHYNLLLNDSSGNRTRVTAVKGRCLNRLTMEPYVLLRGTEQLSC